MRCFKIFENILTRLLVLSLLLHFKIKVRFFVLNVQFWSFSEKKKKKKYQFIVDGTNEKLSPVPPPFCRFYPSSTLPKTPEGARKSLGIPTMVSSVVSKET